MRLDHLLLRKGKISNVYFAKSIISFSDMSKNMLVRVFVFFYEVKNASPLVGR